ncbi:MAG TPA: FHA domain-containing protein [Steroidobacteraceae bacterium]|nr:FHA domain-containing protein [Steroidobacteraceae bacterium]
MVELQAQPHPDMEATTELSPLERAPAPGALDALARTDDWQLTVQDGATAAAVLEPPRPQSAAAEPAAETESIAETESAAGSAAETVAGPITRPAAAAMLEPPPPQSAAAGSVAEAVDGSTAGSAPEASVLEEGLRALSSNLLVLNEQLAAKARHIESVESQLAAAAMELAQAQARLRVLGPQCAAQLEALQHQEGRRGVFDTQLRALDGELAAREQELAASRAQQAAGEQRVTALQAEVAAHLARIERLESELAAAGAQVQERTREIGEAGRLGIELRVTVSELTAQVAAQAARIAALEGQLEARQREYALHTAALESELKALARERGEAAARHEAAQLDLTQSNAVLTQRATVLQEKLAVDRNEAASRREALQRAEEELARRAQRLAAAALREQELQAQIALHLDEVHTLQQELQSRVYGTHGGSGHSDAGAGQSPSGSGDAAPAELRAAGEAVQRLERELLAREARIEELGHANGELRAQVEAARAWLEERDALLQRLHSETANSAVLVQGMQRSLDAMPGQEQELQAAVPVLIRTDGPEATHVLGRRTCIGRTPDNDIQIEATHVSRHHALILCHAGEAFVEDLNSTNGVQVNGRRIARVQLQDGDMVVIGRAQFRFALRQP